MTYSVVVNDNISSIIHTDPEGAQRIIGLDVAEDYAEQIARLLNLTSGNQWGRLFDDRQMKEIKFSCLYARDFKHGTDGHNAKLIIAKFVEVLTDGRAREYRDTGANQEEP